MKTVELVATEAAIKAHFPGARSPNPGAKPGIMSADFPVNPAGCKTALGRWLAETVLTTRFDDDAHLVRIGLPQTEEGLHVLEFFRGVIGDPRSGSISSLAELDVFHGKVEQWLKSRRAVNAMYGNEVFRYRAIYFEWPVYGSRAVEAAATPEEYFDACAQQIRQTGGVILWAGLSKKRLPQSIARTMSGNRGLELLEKHGVACSDEQAVGFPATATNSD